MKLTRQAIHQLITFILLSFVGFYNSSFSAPENVTGLIITVESKIDICCYTISSKLDEIMISSSCDFSGTYTVLNALGLCNEIPLTIPPSGTTIMNAGVYCLTHDAAVTGTAVSIAANNVVLNLNGHTINSSVTGIYVSSSKQNVVINNGFIENCLYGIDIETAATSIKISDIDFESCSNGIFCAGVNNAINIFDSNFHLCNNGIISPTSINDSSFKRLNFYNNGTAALNLSEIVNLLVEDCFCGACASAYSVAANGLGINAIVFNNCISSDCGSGFDVDGLNATFESCQVLNITGITGFNIGTSTRTALRNCTAIFVAGNGFVIQSTATLDNCVAERCSFNGFAFVTFDSILNNCKSTNNAGSGFNVLGTRNVIQNSTAINNQNGFTVGATNTVIQNSTSTNNQIGFDLSGSIDCIVTNCIGAYNSMNNFIGNSTTFSAPVFYSNSAAKSVGGGINYADLGPLSAPTLLFTSTTRLYGDNLANLLP